MPTLGPSLLFAAGLTLGVGAGIWFPRKKEPVAVAVPVGVPFPPSPDHAGDAEKRVALPTPSGTAVLAGGFPGE